MRIRFLTLLFCGTLVVASPALAQLPAPSAPAAPAAPATPTPDSLGRDTPSGMVSGFLDAMAASNYELAAQYLNLTKEGAAFGVRRARQLQRVLDRGGYVYSRLGLSADATGEQADGLPANEDVFGTVRTEKGPVNLVAERVPAPSGGGQIWLVSARTVGQLEELSDTVVASFLDQTLPRDLRRMRLGGVPVGHWLAIGVLIVIGYGIAWVLTAIASYILLRTRIGARFLGARLQRALDASLLPIRVLLTAWIVWSASILIGVSIIARQHLGRLVEIVGWFAIAWIAWRIIDALTDYAAERMTMRGRLSILSAIAFARRSLKIAIAVFAVIAALAALGFNVTTGLAALGIGGLAIALGAQKTIENFVGSLTLIADQPIRVGDNCKFGDTQGTVEDIGMRSTKVRTAARTLVSIPNGQLSSVQIENYTRRDKFLLNPTLDLRYETTSAQLRAILDGIRALLEKHPDVHVDPLRVRWVAFGASSLRVEIFAYVKVRDNDAFLAVQEELFLQILDVIEKSGASLAASPQTIYVTRDDRAGRDGGETPARTGSPSREQVS